MLLQKLSSVVLQNKDKAHLATQAFAPGNGSARPTSAEGGVEALYI